MVRAADTFEEFDVSCYEDKARAPGSWDVEEMNIDTKDADCEQLGMIKRKLGVMFTLSLGQNIVGGIMQVVYPFSAQTTDNLRTTTPRDGHQ